MALPVGCVLLLLWLLIRHLITIAETDRRPATGSGHKGKGLKLKQALLLAAALCWMPAAMSSWRRCDSSARPLRARLARFPMLLDVGDHQAGNVLAGCFLDALEARRRIHFQDYRPVI